MSEQGIIDQAVAHLSTPGTDAATQRWVVECAVASARREGVLVGSGKAREALRCSGHFSGKHEWFNGRCVWCQLWPNDVLDRAIRAIAIAERAARAGEWEVGK